MAPLQLSDVERFRQVRSVLIRVLVANAAVASGKITVGLITGTLSMVADGFHSAMDSASNLIGIIAAHMAGQPPDDDHPYGHRRFETLATLAIGFLLLVAAWEILGSAIEKLTTGAAPDRSPITFVVMLGTMVVNAFVVGYETRQGRRLRSDVLLADASQTRVDLFISASVIAGLVANLLGVGWADALISLVIVVLIVRAAAEILGKATPVLTDKMALDPATIRQVAEAVPGVEAVTRVRGRGPADAIYADVAVSVQPAITTAQAAAIAREVSERVQSQVEGVAEVQVEVHPFYERPPDPAVIIRAEADKLGLSVHEITHTQVGLRHIVEMHVEVAAEQSLRQAHDQVTALEERVRVALPDVAHVITHIEPTEGSSGTAFHSTGALGQRESALKVARSLFPDANWHNPTIRPVHGGYALSLECTLPGETSVREAHRIAEQVETAIRANLPHIQRVTIHTEPAEDHSHS